MPSADRPRLLQRALAQMPDLRLVSTLEMCVDTREYSLGNFGESPCLSTPTPVRASSLEPCPPGSGLWTRAPHGPTLHLCPGTGDFHRARALFFVGVSSSEPFPGDLWAGTPARYPCALHPVLLALKAMVWGCLGPMGGPCKVAGGRTQALDPPESSGLVASRVTLLVQGHLAHPALPASFEPDRRQNWCHWVLEWPVGSRAKGRQCLWRVQAGRWAASNLSLWPTGLYLPSLSQLKLNGSRLDSVR